MKKVLRFVYGFLIILCFSKCGTTPTYTPPTTYTVDIIKGADPISAEITAMLLVGRNTDIIEFDGNPVKWLGAGSDSSYPHITGVIIPSGSHKISGHRKNEASNSYITFNFQPKRLYEIYYDSSKKMLLCDDETNDSYLSGEKEQMERAIAYNTQAGTLGQTSQTGQSVQNRNIQSALNRASQTIMNSLDKQNNIAIVNVSSSDKDMALFVAEELEVILVNNKFIIVDRRSLDQIRREQNFQLSGEVDDNSAVSIGKFAGAKVVIVGSITGSGSTRRLRLRALNTQNAQVIGAASEAF